MMTRLRVELVEVAPPEPRSRPVFHPKTLPAFVGSDASDMLCCECGAVVIEGIAPENWLFASYDGQPVIIRCTCGTHLEVPVRKSN